MSRTTRHSRFASSGRIDRFAIYGFFRLMQTPVSSYRSGSETSTTSSTAETTPARPTGHFPLRLGTSTDTACQAFPPEFAKALGCAPDGSEQVQLENLPDCRDLSISWRLASITGASLGYVGEPLKRLGLEPGERARITIKGPCLVQLTAGTTAVPSTLGTGKPMEFWSGSCSGERCSRRAEERTDPETRVLQAAGGPGCRQDPDTGVSCRHIGAWRIRLVHCRVD